ncbi:MAG: Glu/Leu/Phe/Val dehydrogenase dimerization domain-containing protein [Bacilli bacterium]|nr:Glu/Leu/Phe/Val dehydrogenase dimerization domain-containing protein [Bacilli bacterium]
MNKFEYLEKYGYEELVYFYDKETGLKAITCIHDTTLGPALGGTRIWNYSSEEEAVLDALRLARGMTYKNSAAGLNLGGGKTVIIGDADKIKSEAFFRSFGRYVESLNGRYITAEDVNTTTKDMEYINMETNHVVGLAGKSGNPSPITALGAFHGIRAGIKYKFGTDDISKFTYAIQGVGQTGGYLLDYLMEAKAKKIYYTDINPKNINKIKAVYKDAIFVKPEEIYSLDVDVFVPCALGAILNDETIPTIKAKVIVGTSNNVLKDEDKHGKMIMDKGILYAPDFVVNAGGVINVYHEIHGYNKEIVMKDVEKIYDRLLDIFEIATEHNVPTQQAAKLFAEQRIEKIHNVHRNYLGKK